MDEELDALLRTLIIEQDTVTDCNLKGYTALMRKAQVRRDAIRAAIVRDYVRRHNALPHTERSLASARNDIRRALHLICGPRHLGRTVTVRALLTRALTTLRTGEPPDNGNKEKE